MNKAPEHDTREHILTVGEKLCMSRGFTGMGLSELLKTAGVPKGSFYHYFRSKEAFGVAMLERHFAHYHQQLQVHFLSERGTARDRLLDYYQQALTQFSQKGLISGCLTVKLSAEVCDLSEDMRGAMNQGTSRIIALLEQTLDKGREERSLAFEGEAFYLAQVLYSLWLGANLQAKITRTTLSLESALAMVATLIATPVR